MKEEDFEALLQGMDEARRFLAGEDVPGLRVHFPPGGDVAQAHRPQSGGFCPPDRRFHRHFAQLGAGPPLPGRSGAGPAGAARQGSGDRCAHSVGGDLMEDGRLATLDVGATPICRKLEEGGGGG